MIRIQRRACLLAYLDVTPASLPPSLSPEAGANLRLAPGFGRAKMISALKSASLPTQSVGQAARARWGAGVTFAVFKKEAQHGEYAR
jgi:hypothetical protein